MKKSIYFLVAAQLSTAHAGELPKDVWADKNPYGGLPSITVNRDTGVSITLQEDAIIAAGGGDAGALAKDFLEHFGPKMCSEIIDFNKEHKGLTVRLGVQAEIRGPWRDHFYAVGSNYATAVIDYAAPKRPVHCVDPFENSPTS
jgi:hypothetical protein